MIFEFSPEHEELRRVVRRFLAEKSPEAEVRRLMETADGYDPLVWRQMAGELGLQSLLIPEEYGGSGFGYVELAVVFEEMGRALLCSPFFASVALATNLLLLGDDESAKKEYLPGIASGTTIATVALAEESRDWEPSAVKLVAERDSGGWTLTGHKHLVPDGHVADLVLVVAETTAGVSVFAVDKGAPGLAAEPVTTLDQTRKLATLTFSRTPARLVGISGSGVGVVAAMLDRAVVAQAAEQAGGARRALEMAVEHAKNRYQFGRPIGGFQAIKHKCADLLVEVESAASAAYYASWAVANGSPDVPIVASVAKAHCAETFLRVSNENIQIHGGMGFTWEHPAHLYFKRATSTALLLGDPSHHREQLIRRLGA